jgi:hypothetical protein
MDVIALQDRFLDPGNEYTPVPFWFWNDALSEAELVRQIRDFADHGVMGFVIHPRIGIPEELPYLSDAYLDLVERALEEAEALGMTVILYDEAMYPSGSGHGEVVRGNPEYASRGLKLVRQECGEPIQLAELLGEKDILVSAQAVRLDGDVLLDPTGASVVLSPENGQITFDAPGDGWSILLFIETYSGGTIRGIHFGEDDGEPHAPAAADLLNPLATQKFIRTTHERYYSRVGRFFGSTVIAFFTDEPDILGRGHIKGLKAWTSGFLRSFLGEGCSETELPLLWLDGPGAEGVRKLYRKAINRRMADTYYRPLAEWCEQHGIALTGHPAASDDIGLLDHFHIPGQDVVWRWVAPENELGIEGHHSTAGKCSSDAARHRGRRRNLNEVLGVCAPGNGWALTGADMKWYIDWLAVRGVNLYSPHAFYYSINGPRRLHERPPDVGPNNIWWPHYQQFAQYMKRMSWVMTDSVNVTPVAVLCQEDWLPWRMTKPLYCAQIEFNYLEEQLLSDKCVVEAGRLRIAEQSYSVVLVENARAVDAQAEQVLRRFVEQGGHVIVLSENVRSGFPTTELIQTIDEVVEALDKCIEREVTLEPAYSQLRVSHVVKEGGHLYVLVNESMDSSYEGYVRVREAGKAELWDPWEATVTPVSGLKLDDGIGVQFAIKLQPLESVILHVDPSVIAEHVAGEPDEAALTVVSSTVLEGPWTLALAEGEAGAVGSLSIPNDAQLGTWTDWKGFEHYSGSVTYRRVFSAGAGELNELRSVRLDLGEVHELAEVTVNGRNVGVRMWKPYAFELLPYLQAGENVLEARVTNNLANRYDRVSLTSGLLGPVKITMYR